MPTVYLFPTRDPIFPDTIDVYVRLTGFTQEKLFEKCHKAAHKGTTPAFEVDITEEQYEELLGLECDIPFILGKG